MAQPSLKVAQPGSEVAQPGSKVAQPSSKVGRAGSKAAQPGSKVAQPGSKAGQPGSEVAQPGSEAGRAGSEPIANPYKQRKSIFFGLEPKEYSILEKPHFKSAFKQLNSPFWNEINTHQAGNHYRRIGVSKITYQNVPYQEETQSRKIQSECNFCGFFALSK